VHLHVHGRSEALARLASAGWGDRSSSRLHLPVGGRRFRPCLEDIIEVCIVEKIVKPQRENWKEILDTYRDAFYRKQLKSAVRRDPHAAVSALDMFGVAKQITVTERVASLRMCSVDNMLLAER